MLACCLQLQAQTLKKIASTDLPGPKGQRFDYPIMDGEDHWLLSAHLGPGILYVIDVQTNRLVKAIPGVPGITGLEYVTHRLYAPEQQENGQPVARMIVYEVLDSAQKH